MIAFHDITAHVVYVDFKTRMKMGKQQIHKGLKISTVWGPFKFLKCLRNMY